MRPMGTTQREMLESLSGRDGRPAFWEEDRCGWVWDTPSGTIRILESLVRRGLVQTAGGKLEGRPRYTLTETGRAQIAPRVKEHGTSRPQHGGPREGAGRPIEVEDPVRLVIKLERPDRDKINRVAAQRGTTVTAMVRRWIARTTDEGT